MINTTGDGGIPLSLLLMIPDFMVQSAGLVTYLGLLLLEFLDPRLQRATLVLESFVIFRQNGT